MKGATPPSTQAALCKKFWGSMWVGTQRNVFLTLKRCEEIYSTNKQTYSFASIYLLWFLECMLTLDASRNYISLVNFLSCCFSLHKNEYREKQRDFQLAVLSASGTFFLLSVLKNKIDDAPSNYEKARSHASFSFKGLLNGRK